MSDRAPGKKAKPAPPGAKPAPPGNLERYDPAAAPRAFGLNNTGVICHLNALLQALAGCTAVARAALARRDYLGRTATGRAFYDFVYAFAGRGAAGAGGPFRADAPLEASSAAVLAALVSDLRRRRPHFRYGPSQESASEGLVLLLDMLDAPAAAGAAEAEENPIARLFYHRYRATTYCGACRAAGVADRDVAVQFNLFHFDALAAPPRTPAEFGAALRSHVSRLEDYRCGKCGEVADGLRHYELRMIPEVLVVVFNLYDDARVRAPRYAPERIPFPAAGGGELVFRQVAQVEQSGGRGGGHYTARGLRAGGRVFQFNDASASPSAFAPTPDVYMVFYHCEASP